MAIRLTKRLLLAMDEALSSRTAGEIDIADGDDAPKAEDYDDAWLWVAEQLAKRSTSKEKGGSE